MIYPAIALILNSLLAIFNIEITTEALQTTIQTLVTIGAGVWFYFATKK